MVMGEGCSTLEIVLGMENEGLRLRMVGTLTSALLDVVGECGEEVDGRLGEDGEVVIGEGRSTLEIVLGTENEGQRLRMVGTLTSILDIVGECGELVDCGLSEDGEAKSKIGLRQLSRVTVKLRCD